MPKGAVGQAKKKILTRAERQREMMKKARGAHNIPKKKKKTVAKKGKKKGY